MGLKNQKSVDFGGMESIQEEEAPPNPPVQSLAMSNARMAVATILHGVGTGMIGIFIAHLIRHVQIVGFGYDNGGFLDIAIESPQWRRMLCVCTGGLFGAVTWYYLRGSSTYIVSVDESLKGPECHLE
eukprot:gb/GFBE01014256.1/.p1 GENE.gb/GFBE01014256.1/~~gb/GFBE01014256.1/.p1  ORF type:complete len:128 (+),score=22.70 gb/GFBE01014256.1/:1-384(+)